METIIIIAFVAIVGYITYKMYFKKESVTEAVKETVQETKEVVTKVEEVVKKVRKPRKKKAE